MAMQPGRPPSPTPTPLPAQAPGPPPGSPVVGGVPAGAGGPTSPGTPGMGGPPAQPVPGAGQSGGIAAALRAAGIELPEEPNLEHRDLGRRSPRGADTHIYEIVAHDIAEWLNTMPKLLANAMRGGPKQQGPFKHPATGRQKFDIYKGKLFNDDGTPNLQGRQELLSRGGPQQYARIVHIVTKEMGRGSSEAAEPEESE